MKSGFDVAINAKGISCCSLDWKLLLSSLMYNSEISKSLRSTRFYKHFPAKFWILNLCLAVVQRRILAVPTFNHCSTFLLISIVLGNHFFDHNTVRWNHIWRLQTFLDAHCAMSTICFHYQIDIKSFSSQKKYNPRDTHSFVPQP